MSALPSPFLLITDKSLSDVDFSKKDIKSIRKLDLSKVHDYKMVSTCMPKYCNKSICKPLYVTFKSCLTQGNARHWNGNGMVMVKRKCTNVQIKKTRQNVLKTTDLSLFFQSVVKFLKHDVSVCYRKQPNIRKLIRI